MVAEGAGMHGDRLKIGKNLNLLGYDERRKSVQNGAKITKCFTIVSPAEKLVGKHFKMYNYDCYKCYSMGPSAKAFR
jgi:hypothetical protein